MPLGCGRVREHIEHRACRPHRRRCEQLDIVHGLRSWEPRAQGSVPLIALRFVRTAAHPMPWFTVFFVTMTTTAPLSLIVAMKWKTLGDEMKISSKESLIGSPRC